jgi:oxygen-independent coproporphyrinogen-3 oxidase
MHRGIYVHIPFCHKKCSYCDFYSIEKVSQIDDFVSILCKEISLWASTTSVKYSVDTLFFGGGTPSLLSAKHLQTIYETLQQYFSFVPNFEWTLECNPGTVTIDSLKSYKQLGVNRLSFGVQSFHQNELDFLERIHSPEQAKNAVQYAKEAGFDQISIDLMYALPNQTLESWKETLREAINLGTSHISAYSLIYEEGTPLYAQYLKGAVTPLDEDIDVDLYHYANEELTKAGFIQYEVSNYAKDGAYCYHNLKYWNSEEYIAFGPSAHGYIEGERYWNIRALSSYIEKLSKGTLPVLNREVLNKEQQCFEMAFLGLRSTGIDLKRFEQLFSIRLEDILKNEFELWKNEKLIEIHNGTVRSTSLGYQLNDAISLKVISKLEKVLQTEWKGVEVEMPSPSEYLPLQIVS